MFYTEKEEYNGYIAYYIYGENFEDRKYTLKIMKDGRILRNCRGFTCNGAKTEFHRWVDKPIKRNVNFASKN